VKRNGKFEEDLKFLGVIYYHKLETFFGSTRNGSNVEIPRRILKDSDYFANYDEGGISLNEQNPILGDAREAFRYDFFGAALAFMYNFGSLKTTREVWKLKFKRKCMSSYIQSAYRSAGIILDLTNASSYATAVLKTLWVSKYRKTLR